MIQQTRNKQQPWYYLEIFLACVFVRPSSDGEMSPSATRSLMMSATPLRPVICRGSSKELKSQGEKKNVTNLK